LITRLSDGVKGNGAKPAFPLGKAENVIVNPVFETERQRPVPSRFRRQFPLVFKKSRTTVVEGLDQPIRVNPHTANTIILFSLFGNPVDLARVGGLLIVGGPTIFGAAGAALVKIFGSAALAIIILSLAALFWSTLVLAAASRALVRREI